MCDDKYLIYAWITIVLLFLFVVWLAVLFIAKKNWKWLIFHVIVSTILVCTLLWMSNNYKCPSMLIWVNEEWDIECELIDWYCAFKQKLNDIFNPVRNSEEITHIPSLDKIDNTWCQEGAYYNWGGIYQCNTRDNYLNFPDDSDLCITCWLPAPEECDCMDTPINQLIPEDIDISLFENYLNI